MKRSMPGEGHLSTLSKQKGAEEFNRIGDQVRNLVLERQQIHIGIEKVSRDIESLESGTSLSGLMKMAGMEDPSLAFLESDAEWDPKKVIEKMTGFHNLLEDNLFSFIRTPIGPLFSCVQVSSEMWITLVEKILYPHLFTYLVDNLHDKEVLEGIIKTFKESMNLVDELEDPCKIQVAVSNFTSDYFPPSINSMMKRLNFHCENMLAVLKFKEEANRVDAWKNFIGTVLKGDQTYLFQSEHDAFIFMHAQQSTSYPTIKLVYSLDGYQIYPFPQFKTSSFRIPKKASFLQVDKGNEIAYLKNKLKELERALKRCNRTIYLKREDQLDALETYESFDSNQNSVAVKTKSHFAKPHFKNVVVEKGCSETTSL